MLVQCQGYGVCKGEVGVKGRAICAMCGSVNHYTKVDGQFNIQMLHCPGKLLGMPGCVGDLDHFLSTPATREGFQRAQISVQGLGTGQAHCLIEIKHWQFGFQFQKHGEHVHQSRRG